MALGTNQEAANSLETHLDPRQSVGRTSELRQKNTSEAAGGRFRYARRG
jgi:hypothetical protein